MARRKTTPDLEAILATRRDNGADFWAAPDGRLGVGGPFSTLEALLILNELRVPRSHEAIGGAAERVLAAIGDDGRVRVAPKGSIYPCHTAIAAAALTRHGYRRNRRVKAMLEHLRANRFADGGWRCNKFSWGLGPETEFSNPGVTLFALDAFRCAGLNEASRDLDPAVETLLEHWTVRAPTGPCRFGIGTRFMLVEYPFLRYNLFYYTYVLSFYPRARRDRRFTSALAALQQKLDGRGLLIVEQPHRRLAGLEFCRKGQPSALATRRYREILANLEAR